MQNMEENIKFTANQKLAQSQYQKVEQTIKRRSYDY